MYSIVVDGKVLDYRYKKVGIRDVKVFNFYIGDIFIGQIFKMPHRKWTAISFHTPCSLGAINGFGTRFHASEFMLKVCGFIKR